MKLIEKAKRHSPDRISVAGVLAVRCVRYVNELATPQVTLEGMSLRSQRSSESPIFHASTGLYGFLRLAPGEHRLHVTDPTQRYLPKAALVSVPDRSSVVATLERGGVPAAGAPAAVFADVALRPSVGYAVPPGESVIWGQVTHADGRPAVFARLLLASRHDDTDTQVLSYTDARGVYLLRLPGERAQFVPPEDLDEDGVPDTSGELTQSFDRSLIVHTLRSDPLHLDDPLDGFPVDFDSLDPDASGGPYELSAFQLYNPATDELREPDGVVMPKPEIAVGRRARWDIVLI